MLYWLLQKSSLLAYSSDYLLVQLSVMNFRSGNYSVLLGLHDFLSFEQKLYVTYGMALLDFMLTRLVWDFSL